MATAVALIQRELCPDAGGPSRRSSSRGAMRGVRGSPSPLRGGRSRGEDPSLTKRRGEDSSLTKLGGSGLIQDSSSQLELIETLKRTSSPVSEAGTVNDTVTGTVKAGPVSEADATVTREEKDGRGRVRVRRAKNEKDERKKPGAESE